MNVTTGYQIESSLIKVLKKWKYCFKNQLTFYLSKEIAQPVSPNRTFLKVAQTRIGNSQNLATANPISFDVVSARQR